MSLHMRPRMDPRDAVRLQQQAIGVGLRFRLEDTVMAQVPPEWLDLLRQADARLKPQGHAVARAEVPGDG